MAHISQKAYKRLTNKVNREESGLYYDEPHARIVLGHDGTIYEIPGLIASQAQGDIAIRGASAWERLGSSRGEMLVRGASNWETLSAKTLGARVTGDGTDIKIAGSYLEGCAEEYKKNRCFINFLKQPAVSIQAKDTMAIVTAANAQQDFFRVNNHYFELAQGVGATGANTLLAAVGLTPGEGGWLLTLDNTATDSLEITRGIVAGSACSYLTGSDSFFMRCAFLVGTRANITHMKCGFRNLAAYATANTQAECLTAYDDKAMFGINNNGGRLGRCTSKATTDAELNAAHAAAADGDVLAIEVSINAARTVVCKVGHATPASAVYADYELARVAAIADLATDATIEATAHTCTTAITMVPSIIIGASGAGAPDVRLMSFEASYNE